MTAQPKPRMTVDQFLAWAEDRPGRYELCDGETFAISPERAQHARVKYRVQSALEGAIRAAELPCEMLPDGLTVRLDQETAFEPDALVRCGQPLAPDAVEADAPVIVVEVLSPGTRSIDSGAKLIGYLRLASVQHYLIVDPVRRLVIHHRRGADLIETRIVADGALDLTPPGLALRVGDLFPAPSAP